MFGYRVLSIILGVGNIIVDKLELFRSFYSFIGKVNN